MANLQIVHVDLNTAPRRTPPPLSAQPTKSILKKRATVPVSPIPDPVPAPAPASPASPAPPATPSAAALESSANSIPKLVWDEFNLEETSRERGTRMKIEEVETPYAWPGDYSIDPSDSEHSDDEEGEDADDEAGEAKEGVTRASDDAPRLEMDALADRLHSVKRKQDAGVDVVSHVEHIQAEKDDFKRRRKLHYDEGKAWKQQHRKAPGSALVKKD